MIELVKLWYSMCMETLEMDRRIDVEFYGRIETMKDP